MVRRLDEKIRKLDEQLMKHKDIIRKTRPGPGQEAAKRRALMVRGAWQLAALGLLPCRLPHSTASLPPCKLLWLGAGDEALIMQRGGAAGAEAEAHV